MERFLLGEEGAQAKVCKFHVTLCIKEDVVNFEVSVQDIVSVHMAQALRHLVKSKLDEALTLDILNKPGHVAIH